MCAGTKSLGSGLGREGRLGGQVPWWRPRKLGWVLGRSSPSASLHRHTLRWITQQQSFRRLELSYGKRMNTSVCPPGKEGDGVMLKGGTM